jgi:hypothetical protein
MSAELAVASAVPGVRMHDLQLEHAELLPGRETLYLWKPYPVNPGGPMRGYPPAPASGHPPAPAGSCPPLPHTDALAQPNLAACPM